MFVDQIRVYARAGKGGDGSVHWRREKYIPRGGPDGGDGGNGGSVVFEVDSHTDNLREFFYKTKLLAQDGQKGAGQLKTGRSASDLLFKVPAGTLVRRIAAPEFAAAILPGSEAVDGPEDGAEIVGDLTEIGQKLILCQGGKGGKGNTRFKSATNRAPTEFTPGEIGQEGWFLLELRRIADAGFVGFPNAGKSTLLTLLSAAKPKIGNYPFTTLRPMVGVMEDMGEKRVTLADIPGLIEGAHMNVGLGHDFLRHVMRCRVLLFVVDAAGSEARDPVEDLRALRKEISLYDEDLAKYPWIILANKMDLPEAKENLKRIRRAFPKIEIFPLSAHSGDGLDAVKERLRSI